MVWAWPTLIRSLPRELGAILSYRGRTAVDVLPTMDSPASLDIIIGSTDTDPSPPAHQAASACPEGRRSREHRLLPASATRKEPPKVKYGREPGEADPSGGPGFLETV